MGNSATPAEKWSDLPPPFNAKIDAVLWNGVDGPHRVDYIFSGDRVLEYTAWPYAETRMKAEPVPVAEHHIFSELPAPFNTKIDTVLWNGIDGVNRVDYIFSDGQVLEYTAWTHADFKAETRVKATPVPIAEHGVFSGLPSPFNTKIDIVLSNGVDGPHRVDYIISDDQVLEYTVWPYAETRMKAEPVPLAEHRIFSELPEPFNTKIDAVLWNGIDGPNRVDYIFNDGQVLEYTVWTHAETRVK